MLINFMIELTNYMNQHFLQGVVFNIFLVLKSLLHQGFSESEFYGDLMYKLKKIVGSHNFQRSLLK